MPSAGTDGDLIGYATGQLKGSDYNNDNNIRSLSSWQISHTSFRQLIQRLGTDRDGGVDVVAGGKAVDDIDTGCRGLVDTH